MRRAQLQKAVVVAQVGGDSGWNWGLFAGEGVWGGVGGMCVSMRHIPGSSVPDWMWGRREKALPGAVPVVWWQQQDSEPAFKGEVWRESSLGERIGSGVDVLALESEGDTRQADARVGLGAEERGIGSCLFMRGLSHQDSVVPGNGRERVFKVCCVFG